MSGYTRQSAADIIAGADIDAAPLNAEFNQLQTAFDAILGHTHDASTGNGPKISLTGSVAGILPATLGGTGSSLSIVTGDLIVGTGVGVTGRIAIGTSTYVLTSNGTTAAWAAIPTATGGNFVDSTTFIVDNGDNTKKIAFEASGITTATTRTLTVPNSSGTINLIDFAQTLTALKTTTLGSSVTALDYVALKPNDYAVGKPGLFMTKTATATIWDVKLFDGTNAAGTINFGSTSLTWNSVQLVDLSTAQALTNKTINASSNTITNLTTAMFAVNVIDTDVTMAASSDIRIASQNASRVNARRAANKYSLIV